MILFLCALLIISPCSALDSWVLSSDPNETYGNWEKTSRWDWQSKSDNVDGELWYDYYPSNPFALWDLKVRSNIVITGLGEIAHVLDFDFGNDTDWIQVEIRWIKTAYAWFFGLFQGTVISTWVYVSKLDNYSEPEKVWSSPSNSILRVVMFRSANDTLTVKLVALASENATQGVWNFARNYTLPSSLFENGYLTQIIGKHPISTIGYVQGQIWNEVLICDGSTRADYDVEGTTGFWEGIVQEIWNGLTNAWNGLTEWASANLGFLGDVWSYLSFGLTFIANLFKTSTQFLPLFLIGYGVWIMGLIGACIIEGDPGPLFNHLLDMYHFFANLISMLMNVASTIWNYIKFW
jgi:hypothetical protein